MTSVRYAAFVLVVAVALGSGARPLWADTAPYLRYATHDGLPSKDITALAQTSNGLLWIGTRNGLAVYDGHQFRTIPMPDSVRQKQVISLQPMPDGSVWAGIGHDAVRVAPHGITRVLLLGPHLHSEILKRDDEILFVTDRSVWSLPSSHRRPTRTRFRYDTLSDVTLVRGADLDSQGRLWVVNKRRGPGRVRPDGRVQFSEPPLSLPDRPQPQTGFSDLHFLADGTALVTGARRLFRFDPEAHTLTPLSDGLPPLAEISHDGTVAHLTQAPSVLRYDTQARQIRPSIGPAQEAPNAATTSLLHDREGGLWVGTQNGLLHFMNPASRHVEAVDGVSFQTGASFRAQDSTLWVSTWGDGLFQLRPERRRVAPDGRTRWVFPRSHDGQLHALAGPGRWWYRWNTSNGWNLMRFAKDAVRGYVDSSGTGYFWHNDGLYRHVPAGDTTERTRLRPWSVGTSQHHLMGPAPNGDLILFDEGHLLRLRRPDGAVLDTIAFVPEHVQSQGRRLQIDSAGRIWCPFRGGGLLRVDPSRGTTQTLLKGTIVEKVTLGGDSLAMVNTKNGLYLLDAQTGSLRRHLTEADGLLSNDVNGSLMMEDTLYVGHLSGLTLLPTSSLFRTPPTPHAVLTGLEINLDNRPLPSDSLFGQEERAVGFSYTGASLLYPDRVHYEVRLSPRDTTWKTTPRRFVRYTNLEPGTYRFEVRARLENYPPGPVATYTFTIPPHFYETWWFQLLLVLGVIGSGLGIYRWRTARLRKRQEELETAVEDRTQELVEEKKKTERQAERLAELDDAKNRFFAHVSHEFRTPLSLILTPLEEQLRRSDGSVSFGRRQARRMTENARRLQRLIDQLLDLATLEAGRMELNRRPGRLARLVRRRTEAFRSKADQKDIDLQVDVPDAPIETHFDPEKMETIVTNLVSNAIKFTPEGGTVTLRVDTTEHAQSMSPPTAEDAVHGTVRLEVSDTGPGIDPDVQETIFDRFEQADASSTQTHDGIGLGLALTQELVELHGGTIDVNSTPGEGTTFVVELPLVAAPSPSSERTTTPEDDPSTEAGANGVDRPSAPDASKIESSSRDDATPPSDAATILVVEDNAEMRAYLHEQLSHSWRILEATNGEEGWEQVQKNEPDLVLSDVMMPETDGYALCRRIKADEQLRVTPVLLLTARADETATREGLQCGADDYVAKPFDVEELRQRIANHLAARRHLQSHYREEVSLAGLNATAEEQSFLERVVDATEGRLQDPDFTVGDLASEMALSRRQLTRRLKKAVGETPGNVIYRLRIERAKTLLASDTTSVAEVAYAVGYRSPSSFSQSFRKMVGCPPSEYVEAQQE
ncbi:hypothetical protein BSZ35_09750 [Salinibacter sp. 10B]|nr:hypothetical protein BSZ35_09750 [Salinibacter sp. 10B]